jgi:hypothetical protein
LNGIVGGSGAESLCIAANRSIVVLTDPEGRGFTVTVEILVPDATLVVVVLAESIDFF